MDPQSSNGSGRQFAGFRRRAGCTADWWLRLLLGLLAAVFVSGASSAEVAFIEIEPVRDASLIERRDGSRANGAGPALFVGRTGQASESRRRALLAFDVAEVLPPEAIVVAARLWLHLTPSNLVPIDIGLHRVLSAWGEGASQASGGGGAPATSGDATWLHTFYADRLWPQPGGDFAPAASATLPILDTGWYAWGSTPQMVSDVQAWLARPELDHGWLLLGGEEQASTARRFDSRESASVDLRPHLEVEYVLSCRSETWPRPARALCHAYCEALDCDALGPAPRSRACDALARRFERASGGSALYCDSAPSGSDPRVLRGSGAGAVGR